MKDWGSGRSDVDSRIPNRRMIYPIRSRSFKSDEIRRINLMELNPEIIPNI